MINAQRYPHACKYCRFSVYIRINREVFCKFFGRMPSNYICDRYIFDPFKYKVKRQRYLSERKYNLEDFKID